MSGSNDPVEECPACGTEQISHWDDLESWICEQCSYVVEPSTSSVSTPDITPDVDVEASEPQEWEQSIVAEDKSEANLVEVISQVEQVADDLELNDELTIRAAEIVVEAWKTNFMHGRTKPDTVGASVYAASREYERSIPPAFIADRIESEQESLKNTYQQLASELGLAIDPPRPTEYLAHLRQELDLAKKVEEIAKEALADHNAGGNPIGIAGGALYEAAKKEGDDLTYRIIAAKTGLTKETIWRQTSRIRETNKN